MSFPSPPKHGKIDDFVDRAPLQPGLISKLYSSIQDMVTHSLNHLKEQWARDIGTETSDEIWQSALSKFHSTSYALDMVYYSLK